MLTDSNINEIISKLDLDHPTPINKEFLNNLDPNDNSLQEWLEYKTTRPSIPHLYAMLSDGNIDEGDKNIVKGILQQGVAHPGRKFRRQIIDMIETGTFTNVQYESLLGEIAAVESQEAADKFAASPAVIKGFEIDTIMRYSDYNTKLDLLKAKFEELQNMGESERVDGLTQLHAALTLLFENNENLSNDEKLLLESVQNSLKSSIISERHQTGELTTSQLMMETFKKTGQYNKLSDEALKILSDMEPVIDKVPGLQDIYNYIQNPETSSVGIYNKALKDFDEYLSTKTENRSVIKEFYKLITDSFCV
jgi:hypothetical protein